MNFIITASTDVGLYKDTNQDSLTVKTLTTPYGPMAFALLCDGMGGLSSGEIASASIIYAFNKWINNDLQALCTNGFSWQVVYEQWYSLVLQMNERIKEFGNSYGIKLGTTITAMLITQNEYFVLNVGDTRAYEITADSITQLTQDQTVISRELALGRITPEQARTDPRKSILLQCCGASPVVEPEILYGNVNNNAVYMLCSDGFRHEITPQEIQYIFSPDYLTDEPTMQQCAEYLIDVNKQRNESDNISVILIRTY